MWAIFEHTLKKPNGRWDKQSLTFFLFMNLTVIMGVANTIASYVYGITENKMAYEVFTTFAFITMGMSGTTIVNKFVDYTKARNPNQNPYDTSYYEPQNSPTNKDNL